MTYDAGQARATYTLDDKPFQDAAKRILQMYTQLEAAQQRAGQSRGNTSKVTADEVKYAQALARVAEAEARRANATTKKAEIDARAAKATAQADLAEQKHQTEIARTAAAQDRAAIAALKRADAEKRAAQGGNGPALPRTFAGFTPQGLNQALGAFGLATFGPQVVGQAIGAGVEAGKNALALDRTLKLTKELTGTQTLYNKVIQTGREQQVLYGGSLQENIAGIQGLVITARSTGAELSTLINLSQRLAVLDPAQGAEGARIALSEVLSGDPRSLSRRYEIPLSALEKIKDESIPVADRLKVLDQYLAKIGITSEVAANSVTDQSKAFNKLGLEISDLQTNVGRGLADFFEKPATGLARLIGLVNNNPQALAELKKLKIFGGDGGSAVTQTDLDAAARQIAQERAGTQLDPTRGQRGQPTAIIDRIGGQEAFHLVREQLTEINVAGGLAAEQADRLTLAFRNGQISAETYRGGLSALLADITAGGDAEDRRAAQLDKVKSAQENAAIAAQQHAAALVDATTKSQAASAESQRLAEFQNALAGLGDAVANGLITSGNAALSLASQYGLAVGKAQELINAQAALANKKPVDVGAREFDSPQALAQARTAGAQLVRDQAEKAAAAAKAVEEARRNQIIQTGTALQVVQVRQLQYNEAIKQYGKNSKEAIDAQTNLIQAQQSANKPKRGRADPNAKGLSVLDQDAIQAGATTADQLAEVNRQLSRANLTEHQRNDLLEKRRKLEEQITDEREKQNRAALDAQLGAVQDAQKRLQEQRQAAGLQRALDSGRLAGTPQEQAARLKLQEIALEQQKRALDIQKDLKTAGLATPGQTPGAPIGAVPNVPTPQLPIPNLAQLPPLQPGAITVNLTVNIDQAGKATITQSDPNVILNIIGTATNFRNLSGGVNG